MRLIVQRVNKASVKANSQVVGEINKGLFVLVGVREGDTNKDAEKLAEKICKLRIMPDENDKMNLSIADSGGSILAVSQFTLYADTKKGNRPSFLKAGDPKKASEIYNHFVNKVGDMGVDVKTGSFGDYMKIDTQLDGPVTILVSTDD